MRHSLIVFLIVFASLAILSSCMSLVLRAPSSEIPVSLSEQIRGYRSGRQIRHFSREIWTYHLLGLPALPLWTREGLPADDLLTSLLKEYTSPGQGVIRLRVRHARTPLTWAATILTLGLLSPTAVTVDGDVIELLPERAETINLEPTQSSQQPGPDPVLDLGLDQDLDQGPASELKK
ncbi:MAG: hypothetical protein CVV27_03290 [Candidatus Melainabacteria bacterium HGW-Melainabacteria-1]|nr:MAG: hypothetical protein CVV27_03290 [Candidatus Melainabacteria bacterium HGW-Melainabacteria-1]